MAEDKADKRSAERYTHVVPARVKYMNGGVHEDMGLTKDVSAHSVYLYTDTNIIVGSTIEVALPLPPEVTGADRQIVVRCQARVVRVQERSEDGRMGIAAVFDDYQIVNPA